MDQRFLKEAERTPIRHEDGSTPVECVHLGRERVIQKANMFQQETFELRRGAVSSAVRDAQKIHKVTVQRKEGMDIRPETAVCSVLGPLQPGKE